MRVVVIDGDPWFVAFDIAKALGITDAAKVARLVRPHQKGIHSIETLGGIQDCLIVSELELNRIILRSDKPEAEPMQDWVTDEVLPSIRKTGAYNTSARIPTHLETAEALVATLKREQVLTEKVAVLEPKAEIYDKHFDAGGNRALTVLAKELGYKRKILIANLLSMKLLYRQGGHLVPYEHHIVAGRFTVKMDSNEHGASWAQVYVTPKGELYIAKLLAETPTTEEIPS